MRLIKCEICGRAEELDRRWPTLIPKDFAALRVGKSADEREFTYCQECLKFKFGIEPEEKK